MFTSYARLGAFAAVAEAAADGHRHERSLSAVVAVVVAFGP
ncbi:hypothetical protein [Pseudomonas fluorescens]|nr:hypothetical protein [Pseudomonas fluorescens]